MKLNFYLSLKERSLETSRHTTRKIHCGVVIFFPTSNKISGSQQFFTKIWTTWMVILLSLSGVGWDGPGGLNSQYMVVYSSSWKETGWVLKTFKCIIIIDGQGSLQCCSPWGCKVGHDWVTELNCTKLGAVTVLFILELRKKYSHEVFFKSFQCYIAVSIKEKQHQT